jgi:hypothetical protein
MRFTDGFEKREFLANNSLKELQRLYPDKFRWELHFTPIKHTFDAFWVVLDENGSIRKRVWVEMKIRDKVYDDYMLEKKKLSQINKLKKELGLRDDEVSILYLNFTPEGTFLWDVSKIDPDTINDKIKANKATETSRTNKVDKSHIMLDKSKAYKFNYIINEQHIINIYYDQLLLSKTKEKIKKVKGLEDILFN